MSKKEKVLTFHSENAVLWIANVSKIVSWVMGLMYFFQLISNLVSVFSMGTFSWPTHMLDRVGLVISMISPVVYGAFYVLLMQGLAQLLHLGLDLFWQTESADEE